MITVFLLHLTLLTSNLVVQSAETNTNEELISVTGSKRYKEGISKPKALKVSECDIVQSISTVLKNFKITEIPDHFEDPMSNFFDKLMRRCFGLKITKTGEESLWEMPIVFNFTIEWHTTAFFIILSNELNIKEDTLVEYFKFISPNWRNERLKASLLRQAMRFTISKLNLDLFEEILMAVDKEKDCRFGVDALIALRNMENVKGPEESVIWRIMCTLIVKKFPESAYESKLRIDDFKGEDLVKKEIFIHFLPILRNLLIETREEFDAQHDPFELFVLFHLGDLDGKLPMGVGGLLLINKMFLRSRINLSAFKLDQFALKQDIVERMIDAMFLGVEVREMIKLLFDNAASSIFESFLKYSKSLKFNETVLFEVLSYFIGNAVYYDEFDFISIMIAYVNIPNTVWAKLIEEFQDQPAKILILNQYEALDVALKSFDSFLDLKSAGVYEIKIDGTFIDKISIIKKKPTQLEAARIFLARICGIPLKMTEITERIGESFEWSETEAFINFYVQRNAEISGFQGDTMKFKIM